jgi:carboxylate-amine ligase
MIRGEADIPAWALWSDAGARTPWTVGVEEELMLVDAATGALASRSEEVLAALPDSIAGHARAETHGSALELATDPHRTVGDAVRQLGALRAGLREALEPLGLAAAVAGTHPLARAEDTEVSPGARYQYLHDSLRELARREPTFGLHVHVAIPDPWSATRALDRIRAHLPLLLALSANSPYQGGRDTGMAAIPEHSFVWWDARLQPGYGTLEVRVMDAQTRLRDTAALAALVQSLVRLEAGEGMAEEALLDAPEALDENRFLAARDGMDAHFLDPARDRAVPAASRLAAVVGACWVHARALGCERELASAAHLAADFGAKRQRAIAGDPAGLPGVVKALCGDFCRPRFASTITPAVPA